MELHSAIQNDLVTRLLYIYINILPIIYCLLIALMHICSVILHMGLGPRTKAQGAAGPGPYIYTLCKYHFTFLFLGGVGNQIMKIRVLGEMCLF